MKKLITLVAIVLLAACKQNEPQPANVINLIDLSDSRDSTATRWYRNVVAGVVLGNMQQTSCFTAIPIDHGSETSFEELYRADFSPNINEFAGLQADELALKHHKDSLIRASEDFAVCFDSACITRRGLSNGTDITGALKVAKTYRKQGSRNIIVITADMLHCVPEKHINFEKKLNKAQDADSFLTKVERIDLSGFEIIVLTGKQTNNNTVKYAAVQRFWELYFKACNAQLVSYSSGAVSQLAKILQETKIERI
jgi:hypothetical protein